MSIDHFFSRAFRAGVTASLVGCTSLGWSCGGKVADCIYADGKFAPFAIEFTSQTSAGGIDVNVRVSQELKKNTLDSGWQFSTVIKGFVYGMYASIIDTSDFTLRRDHSYRTESFSRKARVYGIFPVQSTSFKQTFHWRDDNNGHVKSKYKGDWYAYYIDGGVLDQAVLPLQMRKDLMSEGPDFGSRVYTATSKKRLDDDFMVRFVKEVTLPTPLGEVPAVVYELLKGRYRERAQALPPGHDLAQIDGLIDRLIALRRQDRTDGRERDMKTTADRLNALLEVDASTIVSISEDEAKAAGKDKDALNRPRDGKSVVDKASEIDESNARVFFWLSKAHAYLPVQMLAVIDSNAWSKVVIDSVTIDGQKLARL